MEDDFLGQIEENKRPTRKFPTFFFIISIVVIGIGLLLNRGNQKFFDNARMTVGTTDYKRLVRKEDGKDYYEVYVKYTVDNREYNEYLKDIFAGSLSLIGKKDGHEIVIYYNPDNPSEVMDKSVNYPRIDFHYFWDNTMLVSYGGLCN